MSFNPDVYRQKFVGPKDKVFKAILTEANEKLDVIVSLCDRRKTCIQAGANTGIFPHYLSLFFDRVLTFEPCVKTSDYLRSNLASRENIEIYSAGLGNKSQHARLVIWKGNHGANYIDFDQNGEIEVVTIDSLCVEDCDLIYLDIEGAEHKAIEGARNTIDSFRPIIVAENKGLMPEFPSGLDGSDEFRHYVSDLGYVFHRRMMRDDIFLPLKAE